MLDQPFPSPPSIKDELMRTPHWSTLIWAWLLVWFASRVCLAGEPGYQPSAFPAGGPAAVFGSNAAANSMMPYGVVPVPGEGEAVPGPVGYAPPPAPYDAANYPPSMNGWPNVSPYDHRFQQTRNDDGLWFEDWRDQPRQYEFGVDLLFWRMRRPGAQVVGFPVPLTFRRIVAGAGGAGAGVVDPASVNISRIKNLGGITDDLISPGFRPHWGYTNVDESGFEASGFYLGEKEDQTTLHLGTSPTPGLARRPPGATVAINELNYIEVHLVQPLTGQANTILFFDGEGHAFYDSQSWGAEAQFFTTPFRGRGGNKWRGIYGLRYIGVREGLSIDLNDLFNGPTFVSSVVQSQMVGPEIGARWDLGGKNLKLTTFGKVGALVNTQMISLGVDNFAGRNARDSEQRTKISPMIDIGIQAQFPLFQQIPLVNQLPGIRDGIFHLGYSYTIVWMMQRPATSITWADPMPTIDDDPQHWHMYGWNLGLNWTW